MSGRGKEVIDKIIEDIAATSQKKGYWAISISRLLELTRLAPYKLKQYIYKTQKKINMSEDTRYFSNDNPEDFVSLLELIYGDIVEKKFERAGIFFPHKKRIEINECFLDIVSKEIGNHNINYEDFEYMLYGTSTFKEARDIYYNEEFNLNNLINKASDIFININDNVFKLCKLAKKNVAEYINTLFERNIFIKEKIFQHLEQRLRVFAIKKNLYKMSSEEKEKFEQKKKYENNKKYSYRNYYNKTKTKTVTIDEKKANSLRVLGLKGEPDLKTIKRKYKELMKVYHPDLNPAGLEKSQEINTAYSILVAELNT